jgi:carbonic anhydrase/acetyltransferase-like protein (isoleucine patch superfamily)
MLHDYKGMRPRLGERVFLAPGSHVIGDVEVGDHSSIWFNAVVRGDIERIRIGHHTNIQDGVVCHVMRDECPCIIGDHVTVGHGAVLHGCTIESRCLIGMSATILNNARIGSGSIVAAGALVPEGMEIPVRSLVMGMPARVKRELSDSEIASIDAYSLRYCGYKDTYLE